MKKILSFSVAIVLSLINTSCAKITIGQTDAFGLGAQYATEEDSGQFYNYFKDTSGIQYSKNKPYAPGKDFVLDTSEPAEDDEGNTVTLESYVTTIGTIPIVNAVGYSKIMAEQFILSNIDSEYSWKFFNRYPIFYSKDFYDSTRSTLETPDEIKILLYQKENREYYVQDKKRADIVLDDSGMELKLKSNETATDIAKDALVFFVNPDNPVDNLTVEQIRKIYQGEIKNWKELSGDDCKIEVYNRGEYTYNRNYFDRKVMNGEKATAGKMVRTSKEYIFEDGQLNKYAAEYENTAGAIGYGYRSLVQKYYGDTVKILRVNGIEAKTETLQNDSYPYTIPVTATVRNDDSGALGRRVLKWFFSKEGQAAMKRCGLEQVG